MKDSGELGDDQGNARSPIDVDVRDGELHREMRERLGVALERRRNQRRLSQGDLAKRAGISLKYFGEIARGEANASLTVLLRIAIALDWYPFNISSDTLHRYLSDSEHGLQRQGMQLALHLESMTAQCGHIAEMARASVAMAEQICEEARLKLERAATKELDRLDVAPKRGRPRKPRA
jgi:transcriptional regulator with XRE-family HTH domain